MNSPQPALACDGLTKRFGRIAALRSVGLQVQPGECVALFGRNGAGKTTLLHVAASLIRSYEGEVRVFGTSLRGAGAAVRRAIGLVSHETHLYEDLSVADNLRFFARLYGVSDVEGCVHILLERFDLDARKGSLTRELSRGMKQRLAIARAVAHGPRLLLLDEPYTGLDEPTIASLESRLREFVADGGAALMSSHDIQRAFDAATRAVILDRGTIVYDRPTTEADATEFRHAYWKTLVTGSS